MVTKNWYSLFKSNRRQSTIANGLTQWDGTANTSGYSSSSSTVLDTLLFRPSGVIYTNSTSGIVLGSGTTPATVDDYKLESMITSGLSASVTKSFDEDNNTVLTLTITNTSAGEITIGEIGILAVAYIGANSNSTRYVLTERTVLDAPLTIPGGGIGLVTYTICLSVPAA